MASRRKAGRQAAEPDIQGTVDALTRRVEAYADEQGRIPLVIVEFVLTEMMAVTRHVTPPKDWRDIGRRLRADRKRQTEGVLTSGRPVPSAGRLRSTPSHEAAALAMASP